MKTNMNSEGMSMFGTNKTSSSVEMDGQKPTGSHVYTGSSLPPSPLTSNEDDNMQVTELLHIIFPVELDASPMTSLNLCEILHE